MAYLSMLAGEESEGLLLNQDNTQYLCRLAEVLNVSPEYLLNHLVRKGIVDAVTECRALEKVLGCQLVEAEDE